MTCNARENLYKYINAYVDNELSRSDRAAIEAHLKVCAHCANERFQIEQMKNRLHDEFAHLPRYRLREVISSKIHETAGTDSKLVKLPKNPFSWRWAYYILPTLVTAVALVFFITTLLPEYQNQDDLNQNMISMEEEITSAHIRSLMEDNLVHIESNPEQVRPWLKDRLEFVAQPKDLSTDGFNLIGGRLDYLHKQSAASIVYQKDGHVINLFIFPTKEANMEIVKSFQNRGYNIVKWTDSGLEYCAISDLGMDKLKEFSYIYRNTDSDSEDNTPES